MKDFEIRKYNINLRKDGLKAPKTERSKRAVVTIKKFVEKNTRVKRGDVLIGEELNNILWEKGIKNTPGKVSVFVQKLKSGKVFVNLEGKPLKIEAKPKSEKAKKEDKSLEAITAEPKKDETIDSENVKEKTKKE
jgi:ribosomal protein L31E